MRKITNTIALENLFTAVPGKNAPGYPAGSGSLLLKAFSEKVFRPAVPVVKDDCGTRLGKKVIVDRDLVGTMLLEDVGSISKDTVVTHEVLEDILISGTSAVRVRTLGSCVAISSQGVPGVCKKCLASSATYTYRFSMEGMTDTNLVVSFGSNAPNQPTPRYWMLENVYGTTRDVYVVYYNDGSISSKRKPGSVTLPTPKPGVSHGTTVYVQVPILTSDSFPEIASKTAEALSKTGVFFCTSDGSKVNIRPLSYTPIELVNTPWAPTSNFIQGATYPVGYNLGVPAFTHAKLDQHSLEGFYDRLAWSSSGSLIGLQKITEFPLPFREEVFYATVSDNDAAIAYRDLAKVLGKKVPLDMLRYIEEIPDRLEKSLVIIAVYTIYSFIRV